MKVNGIKPIMLRSFGRSGSTLLMQLLGTSSNVVFERHYPFEIRYLTYVHRLVKTQVSDFIPNSEWNQDKLFEDSFKFLGPLPYKTHDIIDFDVLKNVLIKKTWQAYTSSFKLEKIDKSCPVYYAEKVSHSICGDINKVIEALNLFLLRDPRDEFISIKKFNEKRGFYAFGWTEEDTDLSFAKKLAKSRKDFIKHFIKINNDNRRFKVLYEDLIKHPLKVTDDLSEWLGLKLDYSEIKKNQSKFSHHMTSTSPEKSIKRWKKSLDRDILEVFNEIIGSELVEIWGE